jgi:hypothetical protein
MNDELGKMWKEAVVVISGYYPGIRLGVLREASLNLGQNHQCPHRNSNLAPPEYKSEALPPKQTCLVLLFINYPKYKLFAELEQLLPIMFRVQCLHE